MEQLVNLEELDLSCMQARGRGWSGDIHTQNAANLTRHRRKLAVTSATTLWGPLHMPSDSVSACLLAAGPAGIATAALPLAQAQRVGNGSTELV